MNHFSSPEDWGVGMYNDYSIHDKFSQEFSFCNWLTLKSLQAMVFDLNTLVIIPKMHDSELSWRFKARRSL